MGSFQQQCATPVDIIDRVNRGADFETGLLLRNWSGILSLERQDDRWRVEICRPRGRNSCISNMNSRVCVNVFRRTEYSTVFFPFANDHCPHKQQ